LRSERGRKRRTALGGNEKGAANMGVIRGISISRVFGGGKIAVRTAGAGNPRYAAGNEHV